MKKLLLVGTLVVGFVFASNAQEVGVRWGDAIGGNVSIDGIISIGEYSRVHADVSFGKGVGVELLWDFLYRPLGGEAFNWYVGAGPYIFAGDPFQLGIAGEVGLEYRFSGIPLAIGGDWRPAFEIVSNTSFHAGGYGFQVRYVFGQ